ncbi:unnamed protein product [Spirodela intermedia]|uniref:Uncharacterized protein n=1 Tax=Spirodela intermedia TaxID=51605 RepID=A0A7I8JX96_SPIIN|nr:unnamed protein product [Spirodela intermedia]
MNGRKTSFISLWNILGALERPNGMTFHSYKPSLILKNDGERDSSPLAQETPAVRVQPERRVKTKEPGFCYTA